MGISARFVLVIDKQSLLTSGLSPVSGEISKHTTGVSKQPSVKSRARQCSLTLGRSRKRPINVSRITRLKRDHHPLPQLIFKTFRDKEVQSVIGVSDAENLEPKIYPPQRSALARLVEFIDIVLSIVRTLVSSTHREGLCRWVYCLL